MKTQLSNKQKVVLAQKLIEKGVEPTDVAKVISSNETLDPFAHDMFDYIEEKTKLADNPQEQLEEKLEDEGSEKIKQHTEDTPQEQLEEKLEDEGSTEDTPQEQLEEKNINASLRKISESLVTAGYKRLGIKVLSRADGSIIELLNDLLQREYLQRDLYETYNYLLFGPGGIPVQEEIEDHIEEEMEHVKVLQRYITSLGGMPTSDRIQLPKIEKVDFTSILEEDLKLEKEAVRLYSAFVESIDGDESLIALKVDMENIISQEQEHVHDIERWLRNYNDLNKVK